MAEFDLGRGELPSVNSRAIVAVMGAIIVSLITVAFGLEAFFYQRMHRELVPLQTFPQPGVTPSERAQRLALEAKQRDALDGADGRMPIAAAMQAIVAKGTHAFDPLNPAAAGP